MIIKHTDTDTPIAERIAALGRNQVGVLRALAEKGAYTDGGGGVWTWGSNSETVRLLASLTHRGLATKTTQSSGRSAWTATDPVKAYYMERARERNQRRIDDRNRREAATKAKVTEATMRLTAERADDSTAVRTLLSAAREVGYSHHDFAGLVRGAEILRAPAS